MNPYKLGDMEQQFADLIWQHEPIRSRELTELCNDIFTWKRTTTYTMLKRLCERNLFQNQAGIVTSCMSRDEFLAAQGEEFVKTTFGGSLPKFIAAFTHRQKLSTQEIQEIERLINSHKEDC